MEERIKLKEKNNLLHNILKQKINNIYEPVVLEGLPSIKTLTQNKLEEFIEYCESKDVYYFTELPISDSINQFMIDSIEESIKIKKEVFNEEEIYNIKIVVPFITKRRYEKKFLEQAKKYSQKYAFIERMNFSDIYHMFYMVYFQNITLNKKLTPDLLDNIFSYNEALANKLGMEDEYFDALQSSARALMEVLLDMEPTSKAK